MNIFNKLEKLKGAEINEAKIILANEVTKLCRNEEEANRITKAAANTFNKVMTDDKLPSVIIDNFVLKLIDALNLLGFVKSNGEARRLIKERKNKDQF